MSIAKAEALAAALAGDEVHSKYWIAIYQDWSRKLEVGAFLRDWQLSNYHRLKTRILRDQLELLKHEVEENDREEISRLVARIGRTQTRLRTAFLDER